MNKQELEAVAIKKIPANAEVDHTKAEIMQEMHGSLSTVSALYEKSLQLDPYQLKVRDEYARYLTINKQYKKALSVLWGGMGTAYLRILPKWSYVS